MRADWLWAPRTSAHTIRPYSLSHSTTNRSVTRRSIPFRSTSLHSSSLLPHCSPATRYIPFTPFTPFHSFNNRSTPEGVTRLLLENPW